MTDSEAASPMAASGTPMDLTGTGSNDEVCGETYDHVLMLIDERDGEATYECRVCGAEIADEPITEDEECE